MDKATKMFFLRLYYVDTFKLELIGTNAFTLQAS